MLNKSIRLFISTLLLSATIFLGGCSDTNIDQSSSNFIGEDIIQLEDQSEYIENSNVEESFIENLKTNSSRFSYELVDMDVTYDGYNRIIDLSFILTDNTTGRQWLYIFARGGTGCTSQIIEL